MEQENNMIKIIFTDDGPGIRKKNWEGSLKDFKVDQNRNRSISGSGLVSNNKATLCSS